MDTGMITGNPIIQNLFAEFIVVVIGIVVVQNVRILYDKMKHGGWRVVILENGSPIVNREVSYQKTKQVQQESADLSVFLKGVVSPYCHINCDLISEGKELGLLVVDEEKKQFIINLDNNPDQADASGDAPTDPTVEDTF